MKYAVDLSETSRGAGSKPVQGLSSLVRLGASPRGVGHDGFHHETVHLRFGQVERALFLDGVLGGDHHERLRQRDALAADCGGAFGHGRESLITTMVAGGHILIESVPGLAKTTAAQTLATAVSGSFKRVQCTPDLMPSDLVGTQVR